VTHPAETGFDFATRDTVALTGDVEAPAGVTPDFLDVSLTHAGSTACRPPRRRR
jgi:hypothetical protein